MARLSRFEVLGNLGSVGSCGGPFAGSFSGPVPGSFTGPFTTRALRDEAPA